MSKAAIINYNMGNLRSLLNSVQKVGFDADIVSRPEELKLYPKLLLPGVGAFGDAMEHLREFGLDEAVKEYAKSGGLLFGICLGMQLLFSKGYEFGEHEGLGLLEGTVVPFDKSRLTTAHKVPQMGWNKVYSTRPNTLFDDAETYLYFVHSYHAVCSDDIAIGKTVYGYEFVSAVQKGNIAGLQPHPEKSHDAGLKILQNFLSRGLK